MRPLLFFLAITMAWFHSPSIRASELDLKGVFVEKQEDPKTHSVRAKVTITDPIKHQKLNIHLQNPAVMMLLQPVMQNKNLMIDQKPDSVTILASEGLIQQTIPLLDLMLPKEKGTIEAYVRLFKQAPAKQVLFNLPHDFSSQNYLALNPDVAQHAKENNLDPEAFAARHYAESGHLENRIFTQSLPQDFNPERYLALNPDVAAVAGLEKDPQAFAVWHYLHHPHEQRSYK